MPLLRRAMTGREAILQVCRDLTLYGHESSPRGQRTRELLGYHIEIMDPTDTIPSFINRKSLRPEIGAAEALGNVSGMNPAHVLREISKNFPAPTKRWDEDVPTYGLRMRDQLPLIVERLQEDPDSRQAVALIWRPQDINSGEAPNICTVDAHFMVRHGALNMFVHMRSNDVWYGLCYDLFQFAQLQCSIANALDVKVGSYEHTADSMHVYEKHWELIADLTDEVVHAEHPVEQLRGIGERGDSWEHIVDRASALLRGEELGDATETEMWYSDTLAPFTN
jgi:thymidylate synthase